MAMQTKSNDNAAITAANQELEQALQELDDRIHEYEKFGKMLTEEKQNYHDSRRKWLI
jgi:prefoldin subunit 5